ncbi:hypothetical protein [Maribacter sp. 2307ULW6-5]|uniref:hypothetical protein n=1 Tax=Maribacter sp. 2307ULW6-5 TaxID=3386275 RepID=UPI0039BCF673
MKKYLVLLLVSVISLALLSCENEDAGSANHNEADINGVWNLTALEATNGRSEVMADGESVVGEFEAIGKDFDLTVDFNTDPNTVESQGGYTTVLTTTILGETTTQEEEGEDFFGSTEWRLDGNILYFGTGNEEVGFTVVNLTDGQMDLQFDLNESEEALGFSVNVSARYNMRLTR